MKIFVKNIPKWLHESDFFKTLTTENEENEEIDIPNSCMKLNDKIEDINDFIELYNTCKFWINDYPQSFYTWAIHNKFKALNFFYSISEEQPEIKSLLKELTISEKIEYKIIAYRPIQPAYRFIVYILILKFSESFYKSIYFSFNDADTLDEFYGYEPLSDDGIHIVDSIAYMLVDINNYVSNYKNNIRKIDNKLIFTNKSEINGIDLPEYQCSFFTTAFNRKYNSNLLWDLSEEVYDITNPRKLKFFSEKNGCSEILTYEEGCNEYSKYVGEGPKYLRYIQPEWDKPKTVNVPI